MNVAPAIATTATTHEPDPVSTHLQYALQSVAGARADVLAADYMAASADVQQAAGATLKGIQALGTGGAWDAQVGSSLVGAVGAATTAITNLERTNFMKGMAKVSAATSGRAPDRRDEQRFAAISDRNLSTIESHLRDAIAALGA